MTIAPPGALAGAVAAVAPASGRSADILTGDYRRTPRNQRSPGPYSYWCQNRPVWASSEPLETFHVPPAEPRHHALGLGPCASRPRRPARAARPLRSRRSEFGSRPRPHRPFRSVNERAFPCRHLRGELRRLPRNCRLALSRPLDQRHRGQRITHLEAADDIEEDVARRASAAAARASQGPAGRRRSPRPRRASPRDRAPWPDSRRLRLRSSP